MSKKVSMNLISWKTSEKTLKLELRDRRFLGKVKALAQELGIEVQDNPEGGIICELPKDCLRFAKKRVLNLTEEERAIRAERMKSALKGE